MNNLFLSPKGTSDFQKIHQSISTLLVEQRHQRSDLAEIRRTLNYIIKIMNHQDTMDYFSKKYGENLKDTTIEIDLDKELDT